MADVELTIDHSLGNDEAGARLEQLLTSHAAGRDDVKDAKFRRDGDVFAFKAKIKGIAISGTITVLAMAIQVQVKLPWAARPFKGTASAYLHEHLSACLA